MSTILIVKDNRRNMKLVRDVTVAEILRDHFPGSCCSLFS